MDLLAQHLITECKHMKSVDKKSLTFPVNTPAALTGFAVEAVKKYGQHISLFSALIALCWLGRYKAQSEAVASYASDQDKDLEKALLTAVEKQPTWVEVDMFAKLQSLNLADHIPQSAYPPAAAV